MGELEGPFCRPQCCCESSVPLGVGDVEYGPPTVWEVLWESGTPAMVVEVLVGVLGSLFHDDQVSDGEDLDALDRRVPASGAEDCDLLSPGVSGVALGCHSPR